MHVVPQSSSFGSYIDFMMEAAICLISFCSSYSDRFFLYFGHNISCYLLLDYFLDMFVFPEIEKKCVLRYLSY